MLLSGYTKEIFRPECNPSFESVHCVAKLDQDVSEALPYLNAVLGGFEYYEDPPQVMFHHRGRIIKVGAGEIAINALSGEAEADRVLAWLVREINDAWENRASITPCTTGRERPALLSILKLLPKTNCRKCGQPTCMAFAALIRDGGGWTDSCPELSPEGRETLETYLSGFDLEA
ncbi:MAG: (Fe-S)-binding protein [Thermodesulfobacteriota bacterium]